MNWHSAHEQSLSVGDRIADKVASFIGSWTFIITQAFLMVVWGIVNSMAAYHFIAFDPYPFVFLNLFMSAEAAFSTPLILMSQNRQGERDRHQAEADYSTNVEAKAAIEEHYALSQSDSLKLDIILGFLKAKSTATTRKKRKSSRK